MVLMRKFLLACRSDTRIESYGMFTAFPLIPLSFSLLRASLPSTCSAYPEATKFPLFPCQAPFLSSAPLLCSSTVCSPFQDFLPPTSSISPNAAKPLFNPICSPFVPRNAEWTIRLPIRFRWLLARMTCLESLL